jgi:4-hydroxythreonine-4-phosphate dehydrogenase
MGDPCGASPEVTARALSVCLKMSNASYVLVCSQHVMNEAVRLYARSEFKSLWKNAPRTGSLAEAESLTGHKLIVYTASDLEFHDVNAGQPGLVHGKAMWDCLEVGLNLVTGKTCHALCTAPVTKYALKEAGFPYPGHTDWLADRTGSKAIMMLVSGRMRTVPLTIHIPLSGVPGKINENLIIQTIENLEKELKKRFRLRNPRICVSGLNPHAGENGMLGDEEEDIILPAVSKCKKKGISVDGPLPADTMFIKQNRKLYDAFICMYHDQALIALKTYGFEKAVNVTLGLPVIRTSPAHGTALEMAWTGKADPQSMTASIKLCERLAKGEQKSSS